MSKNYQAFLLRIWQTDDPVQPTWRASLEEPATRQVTGFNSLEALCDFLLQKKSSPAVTLLPHEGAEHPFA